MSRSSFDGITRAKLDKMMKMTMSIIIFMGRGQRKSSTKRKEQLIHVVCALGGGLQEEQILRVGVSLSFLSVKTIEERETCTHAEEKGKERYVETCLNSLKSALLPARAITT